MGLSFVPDSLMMCDATPEKNVPSSTNEADWPDNRIMCTRFVSSPTFVFDEHVFVGRMHSQARGQ